MSRAHSYSRSRAHSQTLPSLHPCRNSFSNSSVALPTSQLTLQLFRCFTYVTTRSPTLLSLLLRHWIFTYVPCRATHGLCISKNGSLVLYVKNISVHELILQPFRHFTYVTAYSPTLPSLHLRHNVFSNPTVDLSTSQLNLQPFRCFTYVTVHSPTLLSLLLRHKSSLNSPGELPMTKAVLISTVRSYGWSF